LELGEAKLQQVEASWQSFKQRGWAVHFIDLTELDLRLKKDRVLMKVTKIICGQ
jgi:hypothetical protein